MAEFGAIGQLKDSDKLVMIPGFTIAPQKIVDTTGAGDAFAAGFVGWLVDNCGGISESTQLLDAMLQGSKMGAYACMTPFGASSCPNRSELDAFFREVQTFAQTEVIPMKDALGQLRRYDLQFRTPV